LLGIVHGTQVVDVWGNPERPGAAAAQAAMALCHDPDITKVQGSASFTWPGRDPMTAILLTPVPITKDNIGVAINTSMQWRQLICSDLAFPPPDAPPACQVGPIPVASASAQSQP
jgi:D-xylose transport system substrate-binding protein